MRLAVVIPFAGDCPYRARALEHTTARYEALDLPVILGAGDGTRWSKATAVADALTRTDADVLVVADADVWADNLERAVAEVELGTQRWAIPHTKVYRLSVKASARVFAGGAPSTKHRDLATVPYTGVAGGGIVVLHRELYEQIPLDPRFIGWGGEDHAWGYALETLAGAPARDAGPLWHLWHPRQKRDRSVPAGSHRNERLRIRYLKARADQRAMRALIEEAIDHDGAARQ